MILNKSDASDLFRIDILSKNNSVKAMRSEVLLPKNYLRINKNLQDIEDLIANIKEICSFT